MCGVEAIYFAKTNIVSNAQLCMTLGRDSTVRSTHLSQCCCL